jgi:G:T-mismatch repair DNA endonuclease (very short patch repair protein)
MPRWPTVSWGEAFPKAALLWSPRNEKTPHDYLRGADDVVWWQCPLGVHPDVQAKLRSKRYRDQCPYCATGSRYFVPEQALSAVDPEMAQWWSKDNDVPPCSVLPGSSRKALWMCPAGLHSSFERTVASHVQIRTCPSCSGARPTALRSFASEHPDLVHDWSERNDRAAHEYLPVSCQTVWWKCRAGIHADYERRIVDQVEREGRCRYCTGHLGTNADPANSFAALHPSFAAEWSPANAIDPSQVSSRHHGSILWRCTDTRHPDYRAQIQSRLAGSQCPICAGRVVHSTTSLAALHPNLASEWSSANDDDVSRIGERHTDAALWICAAGHGDYLRTVAQRLRGRCCPACASLGCQRPDLASEWSAQNSLSAFEVTVKNGYLAEWVCSRTPAHPPWKAKVADRSNGSGCPACVLHNRSAIEIRLAHELASFFDIEIEDTRVQGAVQTWSCDIVLRQQLIVVEYDGAFYHTGAERHERDLRKTADLEAAGWTVVRVRETPLPLMSSLDVSVSYSDGVKAATNQVLHVLGPLAGLNPLIIQKYLNQSERANAEAATLFIDALKVRQGEF